MPPAWLFNSSKPSYDEVKSCDATFRYFHVNRSVMQKTLEKSSASVQQILELMEKGGVTNSGKSKEMR